jgi:oxygen-independent coproporphyrinogen-3 oxidase
MCGYYGCHTSIARCDKPVAVYASASVLYCEIALVSKQLGRGIQVDDVHFGGWTPTIKAPETNSKPVGSSRVRLFAWVSL